MRTLLFPFLLLVAMSNESQAQVLYGSLTGNVVVSQGQNVIHGERVVVDTVTGNARVESSEGGGTVPGRVRALILPNQKGQNGGSGNMMTIGPGRPN